MLCNPLQSIYNLHVFPGDDGHFPGPWQKSKGAYHEKYFSFFLDPLSKPVSRGRLIQSSPRMTSPIKVMGNVGSREDLTKSLGTSVLRLSRVYSLVRLRP